VSNRLSLRKVFLNRVDQKIRFKQSAKACACREWEESLTTFQKSRRILSAATSPLVWGLSCAL
jgi:hypothetical protein